LKTSDGDQLKGNPDNGYVAKYKDGVLTLNNFNGGYVGINPAGSGYFIINLIGDNIMFLSLWAGNGRAILCMCSNTYTDRFCSVIEYISDRRTDRYLNADKIICVRRRDGI